MSSTKKVTSCSHSDNSLTHHSRDSVDGSHNTLIANSARTPPSLLDVREKAEPAEFKSLDDPLNDVEQEIDKLPTTQHTKKLRAAEEPELDDESKGWIDHLVKYIQVQSNTKAWPSRLGEMSRTQFLLLSMFAAVWFNNQIQLLITVTNDVTVNGPFLKRTWLDPSVSDIFDEITILVFLSAYTKELIRVSALAYLLVLGKPNIWSKWLYAFVSYSGFMLPIILVSPYHAQCLVESRTFEAIFEPQVVLLDLLTIDLPLGTRAIRGFIQGRTRTNLILSVWTTISVTSKCTRFIWRVLLMVHRHQLVRRARKARIRAITEWVHGIQDTVGICGSPSAVSQFMKIVPKASRNLGGESDGTKRVYSHFRRCVAYILEITCLVGFVSIWRLLQCTLCAGSKIALVSSTKELRDNAVLIRSGNIKISAAIQALTRSQTSRVVKSESLASVKQLMRSKILKPSAIQSPVVDPNSPEYELGELIIRHAQTLAYLERTPVLDVLVTDDLVCVIKAVWNTVAMQLLVSQLLENPHLWHDRVMAHWPRMFEKTPRPKDCVSMIPFRIKFVIFCLERSERYLRRPRPKISDVNQIPHSLSELVLGETFQCQAVRFSTRQKFAFSLYRLPLQVQTHSQKLLVLSHMFVACFDLEEFDKEVETGISNKQTTQFLQTLSQLSATLPRPEKDGRRVMLCCVGVPEFQNRLPLLMRSAVVQHHYPNFARKVDEYTSPEVAWVKFNKYLQRILTILCPDIKTVVVTDEVGMESCVMTVLNDMDEHVKVQLLNTANLVG